MNLTIHTYGYIDAMYNTLQAIAMFHQSDAYLYLVQGVWFCMGCFYAVQLAGSTHLGQFKSHIYRVLGICIIVNGLLLPSPHMIIKDHISKDTAKVDHIPLAFAVPVGILEEFGYIITRGFEQAFRPFSNQKFDYFNYGLLFGQRLKQEVKNVRILEQELKAKIPSHDGTTENNQPLESMASTGHDINDDINEISDAESEAELENTHPSDIALKLT